MSNAGGIPDLQTSNPDGSLKTRVEMDQWLRKEVPKVHWLRLHACRTFGLPKQISFDMEEILLRHWILDEMTRRRLIIGDLLGVNTTNYNDESEFRQFTQRLVSMIQSGHAIQPQHAEGIDMNGYTPPPPPTMGPPGAPATGPSYPPGPPGPPQQYRQPPMAGGYPAGPPQPPPPPPPHQQPQYASAPPTPMGPPGYAPPPPGVPAAPQMAPAPMGPPSAPPAPTAAPAAGRRGRKPAEDAGAPPAPPAAPGPQAPQGFAPAGFAQPQAPQGFAPPMPQQPQVQAQPQQQEVPATVDLTPVLQKLGEMAGKMDILANHNNLLQKRVDALSMAVTYLARGIFQQRGSVDINAYLTELGIQIPQ